MKPFDSFFIKLPFSWDAQIILRKNCLSLLARLIYNVCVVNLVTPAAKPGHLYHFPNCQMWIAVDFLQHSLSRCFRNVEFLDYFSWLCISQPLYIEGTDPVCDGISNHLCQPCKFLPVISVLAFLSSMLQNNSSSPTSTRFGISSGISVDVPDRLFLVHSWEDSRRNGSHLQPLALVCFSTFISGLGFRLSQPQWRCLLVFLCCVTWVVTYTPKTCTSTQVITSTSYETVGISIFTSNTDSLGSGDVLDMVDDWWLHG